MQNLLYNISQVLGITIIHSLWQGLIVYIALRLFLAATPALSAATKYRVSYAALLGTLGWFVVTLFKELNHYNWLSTTALQVTPLALPAIIQEVNAPANQFYFTIARYMPYLTMVYVVGVAFNTLKLALAWNSIYRIRQNINDAGFDNTVKRLSAKLNVLKPVQAAFSEWVDVPCVAGIIKPIILLPVTLTTYLNTDEIEAILLHELAHVKRNDYLFNFIQQVIGIILFFNPFARLISKIISNERENCCDDAVVQVTGSPFLYAQTLLKLEENKQQQWQLTLAAAGKKYALLNRIERIMKTKTQTVNIRPVLITTLALAFSITSIAWLNPEIKDGKVVIKNAPAIKKVAEAIISSTPEPEVAVKLKPKHKRTLRLDNDTTKKKHTFVIEDENGVKTEYSSFNDLPEGDKNAFLNKAMDIRFNAADSASIEKLRKFYSSEKWKKYSEDMAKAGEQMGELMAKQFQSADWEKQQKALAEKSMAMAKHFKSKEWQHQQKKLVENSMAIAKQYSDPKFVKSITDMAMSGAAMGAEAAKYYASPEFQKKMEEMAKYYDSPEFKKQIEQMAKYYDSPKFQKQIKEMTKYYDSPEFKKQMEDIGKNIGDAVSKQFDDVNKAKSKKDMNDAKVEFDGAEKAFEKNAKAVEKDIKSMDKDLNAKQDSLNKVKP